MVLNLSVDMLRVLKSAVLAAGRNPKVAKQCRISDGEGYEVTLTDALHLLVEAIEAEKEER